MADSTSANPPPPAPASPTRNPLKRLYNWVLSWAGHKGGTWALFCFSTAEASIFPIPPDVLMMALIMGNRKKAWWYALVCMTGSVVGAVIGYYIGALFWDSTREFWFEYVFKKDVFESVQKSFLDHYASAVFIAAVSFVPFKVVTITAGVTKGSLAMLLGVSIIGRGARFFAVAGLFYWMGDRAKLFVDRWFNLLAIAFVVLLIVGFVIAKKAL